MDIARSLHETLKKIARVLEQAGVPFCLVGGLAVGIVAKPRATEGIDLLVLLDEEQMPQLRRTLNEHFDVIQDDTVMHFERATIWRVIVRATSTDAQTSVLLDLILADNDIYRHAIAACLNIELDGVTIPVAAPADLIKIKQRAGRPQDLIDIDELKRALNN